MIFDVIIISLAVIYSLLIIWLIIGWHRLSYFESYNNQPNTKFSIIVPARNEEDTIRDCLDAILGQHYPKKLFEVVVVDDHSTDGTAGKVSDFIKNKFAGNISIISLSVIEGSGFGKKAALTAGIEASKNDVIITTDADCKMGSGWLRTIDSFFCRHKPSMLVMPVYIEQWRTFFHKLQTLEFISIAGVTGASAGWGHHIMCNGANLAFVKDAFEKIGGYSGNLNYASGDDVFLLQKMKKAFPKEICFLKSRDVTVKTNPLPDVVSFFNQRVRWFSKNKAFKDTATIITGTIVGVFNLLLALSPLCLFLAGCIWWFMAWVIKIVIDLPLLTAAASFFRKQKLLWLYLPAALLYPFYVFVTFILGLRGRFLWKGRKY